MRKLTIEFAKSEFEKEGYRLLTEKYIGAHSKLWYICSHGHEHNISWNNWNNNRRCPYCASRPPITIEFIRRELQKENYTLISNKYKNAHSKLKCICSKKHNYLMTWGTWQSGRRCARCAHIENSIKVTGSGHPMWKGGISCEPYCFEWSSKEFKDLIKERDGNRCLNPDCWENTYRFSVHHIDYNKKNCKPYNLITLCVSCNARANKDREWHTAWYQVILNKRYRYDQKTVG